MIQVDLIINASWIIPVVPRNSVLEDHALVVNDGLIVDVIEQSKAKAQYQAAKTVNRPNHVLMPGLVNAHTHASMTLFRGYADDMPLLQWLTEHIWPAEAKWADEHFVKVGAELAVAEMLRGGTTCFNEMYFFPDAVAKVADASGIRATVGMIALDFPTAWAQNSDEYIQKGLEVHDVVRHYDRVQTAFAPHAPYTLSDEPLQKIQTLADELDVPIHMHVQETAFEVGDSLDKFGMRPIERLASLGLITHRLSAVHLTQLVPEEIQLLSDCGVSAVHCPQSNMKLASGFSPVTDLLAAGINVAIGTDGASSNNDLDMFGEMQSAALMAKLHSGDAAAMPAAMAIEAATLGGAKAMALDHLTGSLEAGKAADMITVDLAQASTWPVYNAIHQIVYSASRDQVNDVWVQGECLLDDTKHTTLDLTQVMRDSAQLADKIGST
ncbi:MAG: 5-methylthioadenosine/S-adenosylhomocysteine deaminase [Saprospiraceae bacterium]|jgi:5-methylthioadenosine/S-adenosylhomocysteine deaminase